MRKWILSYWHRTRGLYLLALALLVISVVTQLGITGIQKYIIDDVFMTSNFNLLTPYIALFCIIAITYLFSWVTKDILFDQVNTRLKIMMHQDYMNRLFNMSVKHYQNIRTGSVISHVKELLQAASIIAFLIPYGIEQFLNFTILAVLIGISNPYLLAGLLLFGVSYIVAGKKFAPLMKNMASEVQQERAELHIHIEEGISSTREVIAYHREAWEQEKLDMSYKRYFGKLMDSARLHNKQMRWTDPLHWGGSVLILVIGGYGVLQGTISLGLFVIIYQFGNQFLQSVQGMYQFILKLRETYVAIERAQQLIQHEEISDGVQVLNTAAVQSITLSDVSFRYDADRDPVLEDMNVDIHIGKKTAFVGSSGSGKSTLAQLLVRFFEPDQGTIRINDIPLHELNREEWTSRVAIVFQEPYLFPDSIEDNILLGRNYTREQVVNACKIAEIHDYIMTLRDAYETVIGERGITLSGGQKQRLAIARAVIGQPEILILDEATSALDQETERLVQMNLDRAREHQTTIVIAHRLSTIENADTIHFMDQGQIVESGTHRELLNRQGYYFRLLMNNQAG